jgi:hypothetical protein
MTLIGRGAGDRIAADTAPVLAGVGLGAEIVVIAHAAIGFCWIRAETGGRVAGAGLMALITCRRADNGVGADTAPVLAGVGLGASVAVVTGDAVGDGVA